MATAKKRGDSYRIVPSADYGAYGKQLRKRMTWTPQQGMTSRQIEKELDRQAVLFEERVRNDYTVSLDTNTVYFACRGRICQKKQQRPYKRH